MRRRSLVSEMGKRARTQSCTSAAGGVRPDGRGARSPTRSSGTGAALLVALAAACDNGSADQVTRPVALGMACTPMAGAGTMGNCTATPYYSDQAITLYQVNVPVPLPVRRMTQADVQAVGPAPAGTPYPRGVFLRAEDESVEVRFTISNVDEMDHAVWLLIDPWNEFVRWQPGVTVVNGDESLPNYGYDEEFTVPAKQRIEGTITADDMHEIGIKLASVENMLASPAAQAPAMAGSTFDPTQTANNIFNPQNRSNSVPPDLIYTPWIPPVVAGITGFDLGLRTAEPANIAVEVTIDVQDLRGHRFVEQDSNDAQMGPPPQALSPPGARF